jgi:hypothetical protein
MDESDERFAAHLSTDENLVENNSTGPTSRGMQAQDA